jgi:hypothetical protein
MSEPTLQQVLGANATQDANTITIYKSDLTGLTPQAENTAESIVVGMLLKILQTLSQDNFDANIDQSIYLSLGFPNFTFRGTNQDSYRVDVININLAKPDTAGTIDPDDY